MLTFCAFTVSALVSLVKMTTFKPTLRSLCLMATPSPKPFLGMERKSSFRISVSLEIFAVKVRAVSPEAIWISTLSFETLVIFPEMAMVSGFVEVPVLLFKAVELEFFEELEPVSELFLPYQKPAKAKIANKRKTAIVAIIARCWGV